MLNLLLVINLLVNPEVPHAAAIVPQDGITTIRVPDQAPTTDGSCNSYQTKKCVNSCAKSGALLVTCSTFWDDMPDGTQQLVLACRCIAYNSPLLTDAESEPETLVCGR